MKGLVGRYLERYGLEGDENEEKRVRRLIKQLGKEDFKEFPFAYFSEDNQIKLLHYYLDNPEQPRQFIANAAKIDADRNSDFTSFIYGEKTVEGLFDINLEEYIFNDRNIIRNPFIDFKEVIEHLLKQNAAIFAALQNIKENTKAEYTQNYEGLTEYIFYVSNSVLQTLIYRGMHYKNFDFYEVSQKLISEADFERDLTQKEQLDLKDAWKKGVHIDVLTLNNVTRCFSAFLRHKSSFYQELEIKNVLKEEIIDNPELFGPVPSEYFAPKVLLPEEEIEGEEVKRIVTEGVHVDNYSSKLNTTRKMIQLMNEYGHRNTYPDCLQDIKVYFREIFLSKARYDRRMSPVIVKEYIEKVDEAEKDDRPIPDFDKKKQYIFIREKISRGYFREKNLSDEYVELIRVMNHIYPLLLRQYFYYDEFESIRAIYKICDSLLKVYRSIN